MSERIPCEFFLLRYVPDVVKGEFVNIGVVLRAAPGAGASPAEGPGVSPAEGPGLSVAAGPGLSVAAGASVSAAAAAAAVRFTRNWSRVRCLHADADLALLEALEGEIAGRLAAGIPATDPKSVLATLQDQLSNSVQISEPQAALAENLTTGMEQLMRLYVEPLTVSERGRGAGREGEDGASSSTRRQTGRAAIQTAVRNEFERAGVWALMNKRIVAERYTRKGDPLRIDCGYRPDARMEPVLRMFQAVSLEGDLELAKVLAFAAPQLREGVARIEGTPLELTAVVEPLRAVAGGEPAEASQAAERYRFGVETMERGEIRVVTLQDLARVAEKARHELGV